MAIVPIKCDKRVSSNSPIWTTHVRHRQRHRRTISGPRFLILCLHHVRYPRNRSCYSANHRQGNLLLCQHFCKSLWSRSKRTVRKVTLQLAMTSLMYETTRMKVRSIACCSYALCNYGFVADTLARLSLYTVPSSAPAYTALLQQFLPPRLTLASTLVVIVLDWTRPWTFIDELETWLTWVENWAKGDASREMEIVREECRERREYATSYRLFSLIMVLFLKYKHICNIIRSPPILFLHQI